MAALTRIEARMIAEEVVRLMRQEQGWNDDEFLTTREAARLLCLSESSVRHNMGRWPQVKRGGRRYFSKRGIMKWIRNNRSD